MPEHPPLILVVYCFAALSFSCSPRSGPQVGGETHWLAACTEDRACGKSGLVCVCGTCTRVCSSDSACGDGNAAACFNPKSAALVQRCEERAQGLGGGLCLARCVENAECGDTRACVSGACVPKLASDPEMHASDAGAQLPQNPRISDFDTADTTVSWTQDVTAPTSQPVISGGDARILGTWRQRNCDNSTKRVATTCMRLEIARDSSGILGGQVVFDDVAPDGTHSDLIVGPFMPPTDPDHGYPTEISIDKYSELSWNPAVHVPYRILDGTMIGDELTFSWSWIDTWHAWCALQTPYAWHVGEREFFFCVPQDARAQASIDEGKIVLCTSADFATLCDDGLGGRVPCVCLSDAQRPRCSPSYCRCNSQGCDADLHRLRLRTKLTLQDGKLVGDWSFGIDSYPVVLERGTP